ncbi:MAG: glycosyltransferase family 39 protein [Ardenticatenaceae bacterium]|nr:glycosyltransferase family 39 protein [Anaerolineales bacterium]MCB8920118.1 glycosyltransferase family 39 protein [Ardenticatenaceae bacterium]MCB8991811.1 glycosyltransferase family 39 protein [Ardenticatenaceae bacterium]
MTNILNTNISSSPLQQTGWLHRRLLPGVTPARLALGGILLLAAFLNFSNLTAVGDANFYYTAAVKSMLQSWHNFFFVAAEPGASVTVDKPPLGLWIEAISAFFLGVNGFAVVLPNILAGLISIPLMYHLTQKYFGTGAGLVAALAVAIMPVAVAAQRNNTMDGMLTLTLILAAWAFLRATETGKLRHLLLGAFVVGLGFNIKMLQAFLPLPAFYAVYFLGAQVGWGRKLLNLALATLLLLVVSLAWAVAVDLTPAAERPYIGSSTDNTVMELIVGHNGLNRVFGGLGRSRQQPPRADDDDANFAPPINGRPPQPNDGGQFTPPSPPNGQFVPPDGGQPGTGAPPASAPGGSDEVGSSGVLRFFIAPLSKEISWLLPFAFVAMLLLLLRRKLTLPLQPQHQFLLVWGGWLVAGWVFFSFAAFFHAYYLVMLAPPLAALVGAGMAELWQLGREKWRLAAGLLLGTAVLTLAFQWFDANQFVDNAGTLALAGGLFLAAGGVLLVVGNGRASFARAGFALLLLALMITPMIWSYLTVMDINNVNLPGAYAGVDEFAAPDRNNNRNVNQSLLDYLQANTQNTDYLMAVPGSMQGASYVLASGRPVLYMGGFNGADPVVDAADVAQLVADGDLRFVMLNNGQPNGQQGVNAWVLENCTAVPRFNNPETNLYRCSAHHNS